MIIEIEPFSYYIPRDEGACLVFPASSLLADYKSSKQDTYVQTSISYSFWFRSRLLPFDLPDNMNGLQ